MTRRRGCSLEKNYYNQRNFGALAYINLFFIMRGGAKLKLAQARAQNIVGENLRNIRATCEGRRTTRLEKCIIYLYRQRDAAAIFVRLNFLP